MVVSPLTQAPSFIWHLPYLIKLILSSSLDLLPPPQPPSLIHIQVQSHKNGHIVVGELKLLSSNLVNLHCSCFLPPLPTLIKGILVTSILCHFLYLKLSSLDTNWRIHSYGKSGPKGGIGL